ncbi:MAG: hypothetical protein H6739_21450 [Alphaproteobacteria bacterium]|nr:hypothetical protein [Alphaproteobacteria bacterium]
MRRIAVRRIAALGFLPLMAVVCAGGLAQALPEDVLWLNAAKATLLSLARVFPLAWVLWAMFTARRTGRLLAPAAVALVGLALAGVPPLLDPVEGPGLVIVAANVQAYAEAPEALEAALAALDADVVLTHERRGEAIAGMKRVADNYARKLPRPSHGAAAYCREGLRCEARVTGHIGPEGCAMPLAQVRVDGSLCALGIHAPPPVPICAKGLHPYLEHVAARVEAGRLTEDWGPCRADDPVLAIGDFNYVPGSRALRTLTARGLRDAARLQGLFAASWPAGGGWPNLPLFRLDHALVGDLEAGGVRYLRLPDSDHKAVRLRVWLRTPDHPL